MSQDNQKSKLSKADWLLIGLFILILAIILSSASLWICEDPAEGGTTWSTPSNSSIRF